jgi:hypothetical protein
MKEAPKKAKWSEQNRITVHPDGLGWGTRDDQGSRDVWVETEPISIGLSWRPTSIATVKVTVERPGISGMLYVRYTADGKHWTTWQYLEQAAQVAGNGLTETFQGMVRVPYRERETYEKLRMEYARRQDVPWSSDEEALVRDQVIAAE